MSLPDINASRGGPIVLEDNPRGQLRVFDGARPLPLRLYVLDNMTTAVRLVTTVNEARDNNYCNDNSPEVGPAIRPNKSMS